jgi:hypothetical protein
MLSSLQMMVVPRHKPSPQVSPTVQTLASSQALVLLAWTQPLVRSHESLVHGFASSQWTPVPGTHRPAPQWSPSVQALPSSHAAALLVCAQPEATLHESFVQGLLSSQVLVAMWTHPATGSHESSVHGFWSLQLGAGPPLQLVVPSVIKIESMSWPM